MPTDRDLLFGQIVVKQGFCTQAQVEECIRIQALAERPMPLGRHLVEEGFLSEDQHSKILELQRKNLLVRDRVSGRSREEVLFGKLAVREGFLSQDQLNDGLRLQALPGETRTLGEILVSLGCLTFAQVSSLLSRQQKKIMHCPKCALSYTVRTVSSKKRVDCPRCMGLLEEGKPSDSTRTDAELDTAVAAALTAGGPLPAPEARRVKSVCQVCGGPFEGFLDSTNRIRCPRCRALFVARPPG